MTVQVPGRVGFAKVLYDGGEACGPGAVGVL